MSGSDYGYAVGGSVRATCLNKNIGSYHEDECFTNDWLKPNDGNAWLITPYTLIENYGLRANSSGYIACLGVNEINIVLPVVYLNATTRITSGNGTETNPFILEA